MEFFSLCIVHGIVGEGKKKKKEKGFKSWKYVGRDWQAISEKFQNSDVYAKFWQIMKWVVVLHPFYTEPNWTVEKQFVRFHKFVTNQRTPVIY